jgi:small subunit ribosomal protein S3Ae
MSFGKNPKNFSKGRKGVKKKVGDKFLKKEWWTIKAPGMFANRNFTVSPVNQTVGKKLVTDNIKGRVYEANFGDLNKGQNPSKKIKLIVEEAEQGGKVATTNFYGLDTTRDHLCSLIRKWTSLIDIFVDCKTSDGFLMRFFVICFTAKTPNQQRGTSYAQRSQIKQIRAIIKKIIISNVKKSTLKDLVTKVLGDKITKDMENRCKKIHPIEHCTIRKIKTIKRPRFDAGQLQSMHADTKIIGADEEKEKEAKASGEVKTEDANLVK